MCRISAARDRLHTNSHVLDRGPCRARIAAQSDSLRPGLSEPEGREPVSPRPYSQLQSPRRRSASQDQFACCPVRGGSAERDCVRRRCGGQQQNLSQRACALLRRRRVRMSTSRHPCRIVVRSSQACAGPFCPRARRALVKASTLDSRRFALHLHRRPDLCSSFATEPSRVGSAVARAMGTCRPGLSAFVMVTWPSWSKALDLSLCLIPNGRESARVRTSPSPLLDF